MADRELRAAAARFPVADAPGVTHDGTMRRRRLLPSVPLVLLCAAASARADEIDQLFAPWNKPGSPGVAVAVVRDGKLVLAKGYGLAQLEYDVPIGPETIFHVASVSKQFTAFAVARLAADGKLSLDDDIRKHLPEMHDFGKVITIRHLLHHTSGLRDQWEMLAIAGWRLDDVITKDHILTMMRNQRELNFVPGTRMLYCNSGYTLAAEIVARVAKLPFREYCRRQIFAPLGMKHTHFHDDHTLVVKNRAYSFSPSLRGWRKSVLSYANVGATSLFTTAVDLAKWLDNFRTGKVGGAELIAAMQVPATLNNGKKTRYGLGVGVGSWRGHRTVAHSGGDAGFRSHVVWFPEHKLGVAVLSNAGSCNPGALSFLVAEHLLGLEPAKKKDAPAAKKKRVPIQLDRKVLAAYAGHYSIRAGPLLTIKLRDGKLYSQVGTMPEGELVPFAKTRFLVKGFPAEVTFDAPVDGKSPGLTVHMRGRDQRGMRGRPGPVGAYVGTYRSAEAGTAYEFIEKDGKLIARHRRHGDIQLRFAGTDRFAGGAWFFRGIRFVRDKGGRLTGFRLSTGRVKNLWFQRR